MWEKNVRTHQMRVSSLEWDGSRKCRGAISVCPGREPEGYRRNIWISTRKLRCAPYKSPSPDREKSKLNSRQYLRKSIWNSPCVLHCFLPDEQARRCEWQLQRGLEPCPSQRKPLLTSLKWRGSSVRESFPINPSQLCFTRCGLQRNQSSPPPVKSFLRSSKQLT